MQRFATSFMLHLVTLVDSLELGGYNCPLPFAVVCEETYNLLKSLKGDSSDENSVNT